MVDQTRRREMVATQLANFVTNYEKYGNTDQSERNPITVLIEKTLNKDAHSMRRYVYHSRLLVIGAVVQMVMYVWREIQTAATPEEKMRIVLKPIRVLNNYLENDLYDRYEVTYDEDWTEIDEANELINLYGTIVRITNLLFGLALGTKGEEDIIKLLTVMNDEL